MSVYPVTWTVTGAPARYALAASWMTSLAPGLKAALFQSKKTRYEDGGGGPGGGGGGAVATGGGGWAAHAAAASSKESNNRRFIRSSGS